MTSRQRSDSQIAPGPWLARLSVLAGGAVALVLGAVLGLMLPPLAEPAFAPRVVLSVDARATPSRMVALDLAEAALPPAPVPEAARAELAAAVPQETGARAPVSGRTVPAVTEPARTPLPQTAPEPAAEPISIALSEGRPPLVPPRRPQGELAARSLFPQPRPQGLARAATPAASAEALPVALTARLGGATELELAALIAPSPVNPVAPLPQSAVCAGALTSAIARNPGTHGGGRAHLAAIDASGRNRDAAVAQALLAGHLPDFLRRLTPVTLSGTGSDGRRLDITLCVMPDYLALGRDADFVRVPMGLPAARRVAEGYGMILPTARMVDAIHAQARHRLAPQPMTPGPQMASTAYVLRHNDTLEAQRARAGAPLGALISGHKKDVVLTNRLTRVSGRVAIYGWHQANGRPIQSLSTVHGEGYADYSHGIRLISRTAYVNGRAVDLMDLLTDSRTASVLNEEGPLQGTLRLASLR